jgi:hypothetical protein
MLSPAVANYFKRSLSWSAVSTIPTRPPNYTTTLSYTRTVDSAVSGECSVAMQEKKAMMDLRKNLELMRLIYPSAELHVHNTR